MIEAEHEFTILGEFFRIGIFMDSVNRWDGPLSKLACDRFVRREHELLDQLMRFIVLNALQFYRFARCIDIYLHLWKIEIERAVLETFAAQERGELPRGMQPPTELAVRFCLQNCVGLFVSQSSPAADNAFGKTRILCASAFIELNENRMGESIDIGIQTANAVAQSLRQHRDHAIRQINAVTAPPRFTIKRAVRSYVSGNIGDVHAEPPTFVVDLFNIDGIVKIARVIRIDCDNEFVAQIVATIDHPLLDRLRNPIRFIDDAFWKRRRQIVFPDDRQHVDAGRSCGSKHLDDLAFWIYMSRFPRLETNNDFIATRRRFRQFLARWNLNVNIVDESRVVRHHVIKITRMLERSDDGVARTLENANHAPFASRLKCLSGSDFGAARRHISTDPRDHAIAGHRGPGIFCRNENVRLSRFFRDKKTVARLMDRQLSGDEVGLGRKDVTIFSNANDLAPVLQLAQSFPDADALPPF